MTRPRLKKLKLLAEFRVMFFNHKASPELLAALQGFQVIVDHLALRFAQEHELFYEVADVTIKGIDPLPGPGTPKKEE